MNLHESRLIQVFNPGKAPVNDFTSERGAFQDFQQNQTDEIIGFFAVSGIFQGDIADRRYEISQGGVDSVSVLNYFHVASFHVEKTGKIRSFL
jgi:hypothetical protein